MQRVLHAQPRWWLPQAERAALRHERLRGVFGAKAHLDRVPLATHVVLRDRQRLAGGNLQLQRDQIEPGDHFGDRVLDLQPRVHLHEMKLAIAIEQKLERACALVPDRAHGSHRGGAHALAQLGTDRRRRRLLDQLLVAALHRTVALAQVNRMAVAVGKDLDLDVPRFDDGPLEHHRGLAERVQRLRLRAAQRVFEVAGRGHQPHATTATTGHRLDHDRIADAIGLGTQALRALVSAVVAGHARHAGGQHQALGGRLVTHRVDRLGRRADEHQPRVAAGAREVGVLGEKAVARVNRVGAGLVRGVDDRLDVEVGLSRRRLADAHRLVGFAHVQRVGIGGRIHRHGAIAGLACAAHHAQCDLAAIGDQHLRERCGELRRSHRAPPAALGCMGSSGSDRANCLMAEPPRTACVAAAVHRLRGTPRAPAPARRACRAGRSRRRRAGARW